MIMCGSFSAVCASSVNAIGCYLCNNTSVICVGKLVTNFYWRVLRRTATICFINLHDRFVLTMGPTSCLQYKVGCFAVCALRLASLWVEHIMGYKLFSRLVCLRVLAVSTLVVFLTVALDSCLVESSHMLRNWVAFV